MFWFFMQEIKRTKSYSASRATLSLNLTKHVRASCSLTSEAGVIEKDRRVITPIKRAKLSSSSLYIVARRRILDASSRHDARLHNPPEAQVTKVSPKLDLIHLQRRIQWIVHCGKKSQRTKKRSIQYYVLLILQCDTCENGTQPTGRGPVYDPRSAPRRKGLQHHLSICTEFEVLHRARIDDSLSVCTDMKSWCAYLLTHDIPGCMIPRQWPVAAQQKTSRSRLDVQEAQLKMLNDSKKGQFGNGRLCGALLSCPRLIRPIFHIATIYGTWTLRIYPTYSVTRGSEARHMSECSGSYRNIWSLSSSDRCIVISLHQNFVKPQANIIGIEGFDRELPKTFLY